jgi:hypothetical protein
MSVGKPRGRSQLVGRSRELRQEDVRLLEALVAMLPAKKVREIVTSCVRRIVGEDFGAAVALPMFTSATERALHPAFGETMTSLGVVETVEVLGAGEAGMSLGYAGGSGDDTSFRSAGSFSPAGWIGRLETAVEQQAAASEPSAEFLDREVDTARREIVRDWLNAVQFAWTTWGRSSGALRLRSGDLEPEPPHAQEETHDSWQRLRQETRSSLLASLAVDEEGLDALVSSFASSMRLHRNVALPGGLRVTRSGDDVIVQEQTSEERRGHRA